MLRDLFAERPSIAPEKSWLGGGASSDGRVTVLYRGRAGGPVVGRRYLLAELAKQFGTGDPAELATCVWGESQYMKLIFNPRYFPLNPDVNCQALHQVG